MAMMSAYMEKTAPLEITASLMPLTAVATAETAAALATCVETTAEIMAALAARAETTE